VGPTLGDEGSGSSAGVGEAAHGGYQKRAVVLAAVIIICVVLVAGLVFYAMHRSKPSRLRLNASLLKLFSISIEVESDDRRGELPSGEPPK
jgi:hypothetical protein